VNEAVETAHRNGILTAASLMVGASAAADAVTRARRLPSLRVGLHLVLVDGRPLLPPESLPNIVDAKGHFRNDMVGTAIDIFLRPAVRRQVAAEITAQFEAFRRTGLALDHVNAHKHFHLHPTLAAEILEIGRRFGIKAIRVPVEPARILARVEPKISNALVLLTRPWAALLKAQARRNGVAFPDNVFGLAWSGAMIESRMAGLLRHLPDGMTEIYAHPATSGAFEGAVSNYRYADELAALTAPSVLAAARASGARLGGFTDFAPATSG
jgi:hopanoid biosynthesis associated protein HpnK